MNCLTLGSFALYTSVVLLAGCEFRVAATAPVPISTIDPPGRVARLSYISGLVSFKPAGATDWVAATLNRPLTTGDELWTDQNGRAELDLGHAFVRLNAGTSLGILNLDDHTVQISVSDGMAQVRLRRLDEQDDFELDTPQAAATLLRTGEFRARVDPGGGETEFIARVGDLEVTVPGQAFTVRGGQRARVVGTETFTHDIAQAPGNDSFDTFCESRDRRADRSVSLQYVSPYAIGWEDLDEYGDWRVNPAYGSVWVPRMVGPGWAPYRFGSWVWIEPWGWTWIDDAPWGFTPFHYGRWVIWDGDWCWVPGPVRIRAVYAPALVVFLGGGPGYRYYFGLGAGLGVAWFPLGPREIYIPPYRASRIYVTNVNVSHTVIPYSANIWKTDMTHQSYANRGGRGAVTAVPESVFANGGPIGRSALEIPAGQLANARIGSSAPPVTPTRRSLAPGSASPAPSPPDPVSRRAVTVRRTPAPQAVPFEQKGPALNQNPGRPPDTEKVDQLRRQQPSPSPQYRQAPPAARQPALQPTPQVPKSTPPSPAASSPRQTDSRRRGIEQERQRANPPPRQPSKGKR